MKHILDEDVDLAIVQAASDACKTLGITLDNDDEYVGSDFQARLEGYIRQRLLEDGLVARG